MRVALLILLFFAINAMHVVDLILLERKYIEQNDISEKCKRRVAPSILLGKQVMDASSNVMQFSRLDVPYSCSVSVRAEIGYNIIMIIRLLSSESLLESCSKNPNQLIVYELGETFGGYWGHMPDIVMKNTVKNYTKFYTIKQTETTPTTTVRTTTEETVKILTQTVQTTNKEPDYISMVIPLVNVAGNLQLSDPLRHTYNPEELFDYIYDVTPKNGSEYTTSIMPLVQFSVRQQKSDKDNIKPRFDLVYNVDALTVDSRLMYSTKRRINTLKTNWISNRKYKMRKKNKIPLARTNADGTYKKLFTPRPYITPNSIRTTTMPSRDSFYLTLPWRDLEPRFNISMSNTVFKNVTLRNIFSNLADIERSRNAPLVPNLYVFDDVTTTYHGYLNENLNENSIYMSKVTHTVSTKNITKFETNTQFSDDYHLPRNTEIDIMDNLRKKMLSIESTNLSQIKESSYKSDEVLNDVTNINSVATTTGNNVNLHPNGTLVNHESWENVVQSAHVMANMLNKSEFISTKLYKETLKAKNRTVTSQKNKMRKKRYMKSLEIDKSRPRNLTTKTYVATETEDINLLDMQFISRLVELQDDEIEGRVALRYLRSYVGGPLYNICDFQESQSEQMFLFNASRIVIAVSNITINNMMIVLTPAFPLFGNLSRCPQAHLECQIIGSRVCIDSLNACDGIPHCGSDDIYDEDRRLCGVAKSLPHNVYIAAFSFLALLLTLLYTVYYWLKRCVPKVSEAFFIFSDTSENRLQLNTIMRSPTEIDDFSDRFDPGNFFDNVSLQDYKEQGKKSNILTRICTAYCGFLLCIKRHKQEETNTKENGKDHEQMKEQPTRMYSFTELELRKFTSQTLRDKSVQTGDSIDIRIDNNKINHNIDYSTARDSLTKYKSAKLSDQDLKYKDELTLLQLSRETKPGQNNEKTQRQSEKNKKIQTFPFEDEEEIKNTVYEHPPKILPEKIPVTCEIHNENIERAQTLKHLRFNELPTLIPTMIFDEDITEDSDTKDSPVKGNEHTNKNNSEKDREDNSTDFMRFWKIKNKKPKNKMKLNLPR